MAHLFSATWASTWGTVAQIVQAVALLVGGAFAYMKFARGRVLHARLEIDAEAREVSIAGVPSLHIATTITNAGSLRVSFTPDCNQGLSVRLADQELWSDAETHGEVLWSEGISCWNQGLLTREGIREGDATLEPGERIMRSLLIPLPQCDWVACRLAMEVEARPRFIFRVGPQSTWTSELVAPREVLSGRSTDAGV
jgi:hypothetical protein